MKISLQNLSDSDLDLLVANDDSAAFVEKARRYSLMGENNKAKDFYILASVLSNTSAEVELAKIYDSEGNCDAAYELYARAYHKGDYSVLINICKILLKSDPALALEVLTTHALNGNIECLELLVEMYEKDKDNPDSLVEYSFWTKRLQEQQSLAATPIKKSKRKDKALLAKKETEPVENIDIAAAIDCALEELSQQSGENLASLENEFTGEIDELPQTGVIESSATTATAPVQKTEKTKITATADTKLKPKTRTLQTTKRSGNTIRKKPQS